VGAAVASAVGYAVQKELAYVSRPAWVGEIEFYGLFATLAFVALLAGAVAGWPVPGRRTVSRWGWVAAGATILSLIGYGVQTVLDHVDEPGSVGEIEFYGLFVGFAFVGLIAGTVAAITGRKRGDLTMSLGFIAVGYVLLAQVTQSLWD
jgi:hypothetical protein